MVDDFVRNAVFVATEVFFYHDEGIDEKLRGLIFYVLWYLIKLLNIHLLFFYHMGHAR